MKKIICLLMLVIMPVSVFAATEIKNADFDAAKADPGVQTTKGITFVEEDNIHCFTLKSGEYKLGDDVDFSINYAHDYLCLNNVTVTLDLNGHFIHTENLHGPVQGNNVILTITGEGLVDGSHSFYADAISLNNSSLTIDSSTNGGIRMERTDEQRGGYLHINGGEFNSSSSISGLEQIIINDAFFNDGSIGFSNISSLIINNIKVDAPDGGAEIIYCDSVVINDADIVAGMPLSIAAVDDFRINGGTFTGYSAAVMVALEED